jgi:hypothetical protein
MASEEQLPTFDEFYMTFGKYMGLQGLAEVHLEHTTSTRTYKMSQMFFLWFAMAHLVWAMFAEIMWLIVFVMESDNITMEDLISMIELIGCNMCAITVVFKFSLLVIFQRKILNLIMELRKLYHSDFTKEERATINQAIRPAMIGVKIYANGWIIVAAAYDFFFLGLFLADYFMTGNTEVELSYSMWYFYDPRANLFIFIITYICQVLEGNLVVHNTKFR